MTARLTIAEARVGMNPPDLRETAAGEIRHALRLSGSCVREEICSDASCACCLEAADAALAIIRAVFANPTPEMVRASVQGWLDSGLMSGAIRDAARVVLGDDNSTAGGE
jgi:hypothetical protein